METCRICQAISKGVKIEGKLCVVIEIDNVLIAAPKKHSDSCPYEMISEAIDLLRSTNSGGALVEYSKDIGHYGISFVPYETTLAHSKTR